MGRSLPLVDAVEPVYSSRTPKQVNTLSLGTLSAWAMWMRP
jgi:hypothetical protein